MDTFHIEIKRLSSSVQNPYYATSGSSGMDLRAFISSDMIIDPGSFETVPCGIAIKLPEEFEAQIRPRSGLAFRHGITVLNSPGTIDSDYRGEIKVILINHGKDSFIIHNGDRIAQMVISRIVKASIKNVEKFDDAGRGGGFGSTGVL